MPVTLRTRIIFTAVLLVGANLAAWAWALMAFRHYPLLLGTSLIAYGFGLRHAVDADHIAAIDNVTRSLMQDGKRPVTVGLWFSLGHSTVVVALSAMVALTAAAVQARFGMLTALGAVIGTLVSGLFLLAIAASNLMVAGGTWRRFQAVRSGATDPAEAADAAMGPGGIISRLCRPLFRMIRQSWHMYPLGLLFGLGFDTATEIGVLGIAAAGAAHGLPVVSILVFPALFTAGMALVDAADGILMLGAYGWAFIRPLRKLYYNMIVTLLSAVVALAVGGIELLGLLGDRLGLRGTVWHGIGWMNDNLGMLGFGVIGVFAGGWIVSMLVWRWQGYHRLDAPASVP